MKEPSTPQGLGRNSTNPTPTANEDSAEWLAVFKAQAIQDTTDDVVGYVVKRATCIRELQGSAADAAIGAIISMRSAIPSPASSHGIRCGARRCCTSRTRSAAGSR